MNKSRSNTIRRYIRDILHGIKIGEEIDILIHISSQRNITTVIDVYIDRDFSFRSYERPNTFWS